MEIVIRGLDFTPIDVLTEFAAEIGAEMYISNGKLVIERRANEAL